MRFFILAILLCLIALSTTRAQVRGVCTTPGTEETVERIRAHQKSLANAPLMLRSPIQKYAPLTFILVADDNGNGRLLEERILDEIAYLNILYAPQELTFYLDEVRYLDDTDAFNEPASNPAIFQMRLKEDNNAINVFVTNNANSGSNIGIGLGYYSGSEDWIVVRKNEVDGNSGTLGHELGHFFSLPHPHLGWDCEPYDEDTHGNPVSILFSPCISSLRVEFQDGTNCNNSGDLICDTPPDYNFGFGWSVGGDQCADFTDEIMDPQGDVVDPMENNIMSYFLNCDDYMFTPTQQNIVQNDYFSPARNYIRTGVTPPTDTVPSEVTYFFPINGEETPSNEVVDFDWDDTPGATHYLFIVDRLSTFTFNPQRIWVEGSFLSLAGLEAERTYFWRVWPYNATQTYAGWGETQSFFTGSSTAVRDIPGVEQFGAFPNPVTGEHLLVTLQSEESFSADMMIMDITGRPLQTIAGLQINSGQQWQYSLDVSAIVPGLYILHIRSEKGVLSRKFSVQ